MKGMPWTQMMWIGTYLVWVTVGYPGSWNCSTEPDVPCTAYEIIDDSVLPESDYFCLDNFPLKYSQNHTEHGVVINWSFQFNDTQIDGFCVETPNLWRVLLIQNLEEKSFPFPLNLTTRIDDNDDDDDEEIYIHPLMTQKKKWNHVTRNTEFYVRQISSETVTIVFTLDMAVQSHMVEQVAGNCDSYVDESATESFRIHSNKVIFSNLTFGNYCFMFTPVEPYPLDPAHCVCYYGSTTLRQCNRCGRSEMTYTMKELEEGEIFSETVTVSAELPEATSTQKRSNHVPLVTLLGISGGSIAAILIVIVVIIRIQHIRNFLVGVKLHRRKILVLATNDSDIHSQSVECFTYCLQTYCRCHVDVITGDSKESFRNVDLVTFDVVIVMLSQKLLTLLQEIECCCLKNRRLLGTRRSVLVQTLSKLVESDSETSGKVVTVHFNKSPKLPNFKNILSASNFHISDDFKILLFKIHHSNQTLPNVSRECSKMMKQLQNTDKFSELKYLVNSVEQLEMSTEEVTASKIRLQSLNVDSGLASSVSRVSIAVNTQPRSDENTDELSSCSVWSDSGRKHHDKNSLHHSNELYCSKIPDCAYDSSSLATIGEFSV